MSADRHAHQRAMHLCDEGLGEDDIRALTHRRVNALAGPRAEFGGEPLHDVSLRGAHDFIDAVCDRAARDGVEVVDLRPGLHPSGEVEFEVAEHRAYLVVSPTKVGTYDWCLLLEDVEGQCEGGTLDSAVAATLRFLVRREVRG